MKLKNTFRRVLFLTLIIALPHHVFSVTLDIPPRPEGALSGSQFVAVITPLSLTEREDAIFTQVAMGNIPDFMRNLCEILVTKTTSSGEHTAIYYVTADYFAVGSNEDYFLCPMTPTLGQRVADLLGCNLPTTKMVDDIYAAAEVKLAPQPIPPSPEMTTVPVFAQHNTMVWEERSKVLAPHPLGDLVGGDKKDVVVTTRLATSPGKVAIYGWHKLDGQPIQPLYLGHSDTYADYSHGIRLAHLSMKVDGTPTTLTTVLASADLAPLLSNEGVVLNPRYPLPSDTPTPTPTPIAKTSALLFF